MRFKSWFAEYGGGLGATTSVMHGGLGDPVMTGNANMPYGVRSKTQTKDGRADWEQDNDPKVNPNKLFGIRKPDDMKRRPKGINNTVATGVPLRVDRPDIPR